jgi:hypothetical protein
MKKSASILLTVFFIQNLSSAQTLKNQPSFKPQTVVATAPDNSEIFAEPSLGPAVYTPVRDQGAAGFCWAYSMTGFVESEALKNKISVTLSPEYLALNHMANLLESFIPLFDSVSNSIFGIRFLLDHFLLTKISTEGAFTLSESLEDLNVIGAVPESIFSYKEAFITNAQGQPVAPSPSLDQKSTQFISDHMANPVKVSFYRANIAHMKEEFFQALGVRPPMPTDTFTYEGKTYTPVSFLRDYLKFDASNYQEVAVSDHDYDDFLDDAIYAFNPDAEKALPAKQYVPLMMKDGDLALSLLQKVVSDNESVPVNFVIYEDQKMAESTGVFSSQDCTADSCQSLESGHSVLLVGLKMDQDPTKSKEAVASALIVKNSWGPKIGLTDKGVDDPLARSQGAAGFFIIKKDYLEQAETEKNSNGWSFLVPKKYLNGLKIDGQNLSAATQ